MKKFLLSILFIALAVIVNAQIFNPNTLPNTSPWPASSPILIGTGASYTTSQLEVASDITIVSNGGLGTTPLTAIGYLTTQSMSIYDAPIFDVKLAPSIHTPASSIFTVTSSEVNVAPYVITNLGTTFLNGALLNLKENVFDGHFLGFKSAFGGESLDGPVLAGHGSGILGTTQNGENMALYWDSEGKVGIGTTNFVGTHKLYVAGSIIAEEIIVQLQGLWSDYVFEDNYKLLSLAELEKYIEKEGHLPNVPSAKTVDEEGIKIAEMNVILLEKIEELTLHLIQLNKDVELLKKKN